MSQFTIPAEELNTNPADDAISTAAPTASESSDTVEAPPPANATPVTIENVFDVGEPESAAPAITPESVVASLDNVFDKHGPGVIWFSGIQKPMTVLNTPDDYAVDITFVKVLGSENRMISVFYEDTRTIKKVSNTTARLGDRLEDNGLVINIPRAEGQRVYATMRLTVDEVIEKLGDKFADLTWAPRTKKRKPKDDKNTEG